jgi:hypothetical protein
MQSALRHAHERETGKKSRFLLHRSGQTIFGDSSAKKLFLPINPEAIEAGSFYWQEDFPGVGTIGRSGWQRRPVRLRIFSEPLQPHPLQDPFVIVQAE